MTSPRVAGKSAFSPATPRNKSAKDVYNQIKLFHQDDITQLPIDPPNLGEYFRQIDNGAKRLQDLLVHVLIRRTRATSSAAEWLAPRIQVSPCAN